MSDTGNKAQQGMIKGLRTYEHTQRIMNNQEPDIEQTPKFKLRRVCEQESETHLLK